MVFLVFTGICIIALPFVMFSAFSLEPEEAPSAVMEIPSVAFAQDGETIFENYERISKESRKNAFPPGHMNQTP